MTDQDKFVWSAAITQASWQVTKAMLALAFSKAFSDETKRLLKFIKDEIEKERKE